jgi:hypothetical protein
MKNVSLLLVTLDLSVGALGATSEHAPAVSCLVTPATSGRYGNDSLTVGLPSDGRFVFEPGGPGFVDHDGALGIKFGWVRHKKGYVSVGGRRLDAPAPPARAYFSDGYGDSGFLPSYLVFPTPGCWEITGKLSGATLTFVVLVELIGDGPSWRYEGNPHGWRLTTGCSGPEIDKVPSIITIQCPAAEPGR